tara:strand:+ start:831 stop:1031 length:201 start_codon:yes stop_codon:yes gene_type:complete
MTKKTKQYLLLAAVGVVAYYMYFKKKSTSVSVDIDTPVGEVSGDMTAGIKDEEPTVMPDKELGFTK